MVDKVGVLGSGEVAQVLAKGFKSKGCNVRIGSREPSKLAAYARENGIAAGTFAEVAAHAELAVLSVHGQAAPALVASLASALSGKIVIDTTNPIAEGGPEGGILRFFTGPNESLMERLQAAAPGARFVKAWNSVGSANMIDPKFAGGPPTMFICGNDPRAKDEVAAILKGFGWDVEDVGDARGARAVEPLCQLWCARGFLHNQWNHAFKVLRA